MLLVSSLFSNPRELPSSYLFRTGTASSSALTASCLCGAVRIEVNLTTTTLRPLARCACLSCRRYGVASFASYLEIDALPEEAEYLAYDDSCATFGAIERLACKHCRSKIGARRRDDGASFLAAGCFDDIPESLAARWRGDDAETKDDAPWMRLLPVQNIRALRTSSTFGGGCRCGACRFRVRGLFPGELQHCYCSICRKLSGSAFQTWMPARALRWTTTGGGALDLVRTTPHGRRHQCRRCGSVMTIIYDSQPETPWPAAGAIDDDAFDDDDDKRASIYRIIHICCDTLPPWFRLPKDGYPRLRYAS